jgi:putative endonuclease
LGGYLYILRCADGSYYVGSTRASLELRIAQHNDGTFGGYTSTRRPVHFVFHQEFDRITDLIAAERQVKRWTRAKKEALIRGDYAMLRQLARGRDRDGTDIVQSAKTAAQVVFCPASFASATPARARASARSFSGWPAWPLTQNHCT